MLKVITKEILSLAKEISEGDGIGDGDPKFLPDATLGMAPPEYRDLCNRTREDPDARPGMHCMDKILEVTDINLRPIVSFDRLKVFKSNLQKIKSADLIHYLRVFALLG